MKIFIVDDEENIRKALNRMLSRKYEIFMAENGMEGLQTYRNTQLDLIISDVDMPELGGLEMLKEIRKESDIPIIMMSGRPENEEPALQAGATMYFDKPFDFHELLETIRSYQK